MDRLVDWLLESACVGSTHHLIIVVLGSKPYDSLTVDEFLAPYFHVGKLLFILLSMWASYSPRESLGMLGHRLSL